MRLHSDTLFESDIREALRAEIETGRIADHVTFKLLRAGRSTVTNRAFDVQLEAGQRDRGRRAGNSGSYGAMRPEHDGYAATYDEWGWFLAALYKLDATMIVGTPKSPVYNGGNDFHHRTGLTYNPDELLPQLEAGYWGTDDDTSGDPYPYREGRKLNGRQGYGRLDFQTGEAHIARGWSRTVLDPRMPLTYRQFAHIL